MYVADMSREEIVEFLRYGRAGLTDWDIEDLENELDLIDGGVREP